MYHDRNHRIGIVKPPRRTNGHARPIMPLGRDAGTTVCLVTEEYSGVTSGGGTSAHASLAWATCSPERVIK